MKRFLILFFISTFSIAENDEVTVDPFESTNRIVFEISDDLDTMILRPVAEIYRDVTPRFVKNSISNKSLIIHDSGRQSRDLIYAGDVINKIYEIIKENKFKKKIYEVCKGKNISINKLSNLIDKITKKHNNIKKIKAPVGYDTKVKNKKKKFNQTYISYLNKRLLSVLNWYREQN